MSFQPSPLPIAALAVGLLLVASVVVAAPPQLEWSRSYGGDMDDVGLDVVGTGDGGFIIAGYTESSGAGGRDVYLVAVDSAGQVLWERTHGGAAHDACRAIIRTADGGYALTGYTGLTPQTYSVLLMKLDSQGNLEWENSFVATGGNEGLGLDQLSDDGFLLCAEKGFYLIRTDADGNQVWARHAGDVYNDKASSMNRTPGGEYLLAGSWNYSVMYPDFDARIIKLNSGGTTILNKTYDHGIDDMAQYAIEASNGDIVFSGASGSGQMWRTNSSGSVIWRRTFEAGWTSGIIRHSDGGFLVVGSDYAATGAYQVFLEKVTADGAMVYRSLEGGAYYDWSRSHIRADGGGYLVVGQATEPDGYGWDMLALRFEADTSDVTAVGLPSHGSDLQLSNHPNPFNPRTVISFNLPAPGSVTLRIFDFRGRQVRTLLHGQSMSAGPQEMIWGGTDDTGRALAAGVYFSQVVSGSLSETRRLTLLK